MDYRQTLEYLYHKLPMFQRQGKVAFKKDLSNTITLLNYLDNPHLKFKSVHVAGTNGKGSTCHMLSAVLQKAGYNVGLYTSPHLKEFTERIRISGQQVSQAYVVDFIEQHKNKIEEIQPSFFELTVVMAFNYFASQNVDIAIVETGLGGRLDSTNVITPLLSIITNISYDHMDLLGDTLPEIAGEKAGIIKNDVPVVISSTQEEVMDVFKNKAFEKNAEIYFADQLFSVKKVEEEANAQVIQVAAEKTEIAIQLDLLGSYQSANIPGVLLSLELLNKKGYSIGKEHLFKGLQNVCPLTGLKGRWQVLGENPRIICDAGHNKDGIQSIVNQLSRQEFNRLFFILGTLKDKPLDDVLQLLPKQAYYIFCEADIPRALDANTLMQQAGKYNLKGESASDVNRALQRAKEMAENDDLIFIGGSSFIIAELNDL